MLTSAAYIIPYTCGVGALPSTLKRGQWLVPRLVNRRGSCSIIQSWEKGGALLIDKVLSYSSEGNMTPIYGCVEKYWKKINDLMQDV